MGFDIIKILCGLLALINPDLGYSNYMILNNNWSHFLASVFVAIISANVTFFLTQFEMIGPVLASSLVGLLGYLFIKQYAALVYCASFVGMSSVAVGYNHYLISLASFLAFVVFHLSTNYLTGHGGKLGTIAFVASILVYLLFL